MVEEEKKQEGRPISRLQISSESSVAVDAKLPEHPDKSQVFHEPSSVSLSVMDDEWVARNVGDQADQRDSDVKKEAVEKSSS